MRTCLFLLLFVPQALFSQYHERTVLVSNIGIGAFTSAIGAVINKPKNGDWKKFFIRGLWQGATGGLLNYTGKKTLYFVNSQNEPGFGWPAKVLHAAGLSIIENASLNEPFLQNWNIDYGPVRFDFSLQKKNKFKARLLPESIVSIINASKIARFNLSRTLSTGNLVFISKEPYVTYRNYTDIAFSFGRSIALSEPGNNSYKIIAHEIVHQFQFGDFQVLNTWLKPLKPESKTLNKIFSKYIYFNIPFFWGIYSLSGRYPPPHYFRNFFEFEAERFSTGKYVPR